jgi:hypothetical protein
LSVSTIHLSSPSTASLLWKVTRLYYEREITPL